MLLLFKCLVCESRCAITNTKLRCSVLQTVLQHDDLQAGLPTGTFVNTQQLSVAWHDTATYNGLEPKVHDQEQITIVSTLQVHEVHAMLLQQNQHPAL